VKNEHTDIVKVVVHPCLLFFVGRRYLSISFKQISQMGFPCLSQYLNSSTFYHEALSTFIIFGILFSIRFLVFRLGLLYTRAHFSWPMMDCRQFPPHAIQLKGYRSSRSGNWNSRLNEGHLKMFEMWLCNEALKFEVSRKKLWRQSSREQLVGTSKEYHRQLNTHLYIAEIVHNQGSSAKGTRYHSGLKIQMCLHW
jgi:hypothetical protein